MAGYYTSVRKDPSLKRPRSYLWNSGLTPNPRVHTNGDLDSHTVTSYRSRDDLGVPNKSFGMRDPFESFYAYGSWRFDTGHPFQVDHSTEILTHPMAYAQGYDGSNRLTIFRGPLIPTYGGFGSNPIPISPIDSSYWGGRLISETVPTNPVANVAQSIAELIREGVTLPGAQFIQALRTRTGFLRSVGSEYLNVEFGWKPLISDMEDVFRAIIQSRKILENLEKNSGSIVRRKRVLDEVRILSDYSVVAINQAWVPPTGGSSNIYNSIFDGFVHNQNVQKNRGPLERTDLKTEQYSFSGAYSYYFENGSDPIQKLQGYEQRINALLGVRVLTPEVLWELAPWSWLADYFANFGHIASNLARFSTDGLVMKYGYLMRHSVSKRIYTQNGVVFRGGVGPGPFSITLQLERKERVRATPFGFGLNPNSFTTRQWAILAALGLTKAPRVLP